jgi:branched-chain amino acid transport system substrate-binding protein
VHDLDWKPLFFMSIVSASVGAVIKPAGPESGVGMITAGSGKDPNDPTWKNDAGMNEWRDFMAKYMPDADTADGNCVFAYTVSKARLSARSLNNDGKLPPVPDSIGKTVRKSGIFQQNLHKSLISRGDA